MLDKTLRSRKPINGAKEASKILSRMVLDNNREFFVVLNLDARNIPISAHIISIGTLNASLVHPRETFYKAIKCKAASMIVAHNHPSGGLEPSEADLLLTKRLQNAGEILGIEVVDSLVMDKAGNYRSII